MSKAEAQVIVDYIKEAEAGNKPKDLLRTSYQALAENSYSISPNWTVTISM